MRLVMTDKILYEAGNDRQTIWYEAGNDKQRTE